MITECENYTDIEIIIGSYEEFVLGFKAMKTEDGVSLSQSFANHSHRASVRCVAGGGRYMASGGADDLIQLYDMKLRKEMGVLMHHDRTVNCLNFVGNSHLASGSDDGELTLWRTGSWQCEKTFQAHPDGGICAIAIHPSGKLCLTAGKDQKLRTWSLVKGRAAYTTNLHAIVEQIAWSPTGDHYALLKLTRGGAQFSVDIYETATAAVVYSIIPESRPSCICFMQAHVIAIGTISGTVELHSVSDKSLLTSWQAHEGRIRCLQGASFTVGGKWLVSAANNGDIAIWKYQDLNPDVECTMKTPQRIGFVGATCRVTCMALICAPDGSMPCKSEASVLLDKCEDVKDVPTSTVSSREKVMVELEDSSEEEVVSTLFKNSKQKLHTKIDGESKKTVSKSKKNVKTGGVMKKKKRITKMKKK